MMETTAIVLACEKVAIDTYALVLKTEAAKRPIMPGKFVHIKVPGHPEMVLRRPISIHATDPQSQIMKLIIQRKGEGTQAITDVKEGDQLNVLGPLGRGFELPEGAKRIALVGGGLGVAPLYTILQRFSGVEADAFLGFRGKDYAYAVDCFVKAAHAVHLASDDGTLGTKGFVTDLLNKEMEKAPYDAVFACGPTPMFKALGKVMENYPQVPCYVSLEQHMGCGIGGCYTCSCKVKEGDNWHYRRVCLDGPVFEIREVEL